MEQQGCNKIKMLRSRMMKEMKKKKMRKKSKKN